MATVSTFNSGNISVHSIKPVAGVDWTMSIDIGGVVVYLRRDEVDYLISELTEVQKNNG